jgi:hypothetical protein
MLGVVESGPNTCKPADVVHNMEEYEAKWAYSARNYAAAITAYDCAETYFREGGSRLYVGRVSGPAAAKATIPIPGSTLVVWNADAIGNGEYGNDLNVEIRTTTQDASIPAGNYRIRVKTDGGTILEESYDLADKTAGANWAKGYSKYIVLRDNTQTTNPVAGTYSLAGGSNDSANVVTAQWQAAALALTSDLGPGIVFAPGLTTSAGQAAIAASIVGQARAAFLDGVDTATVATLTAMPPAVIDGVDGRSRYCGLFAPYLIIPGLTVGSTRTIPPAAAVAGVFARNMAGGISPNEPSAGELGKFNTVLALTQSYTDASRQTLNSAGVNVIRDIYGDRKVYGWRTTADPVLDSRWLNLGNSIMVRSVTAQAGAVGERFVFRQIDGQGILISQFGAALAGEVCAPLFFAGSLYGDSPSEAFNVDVGPSVNTPATIANGELRAVISMRMSPFAEEVRIEIVKYLVTESLAA